MPYKDPVKQAENAAKYYEAHRTKIDEYRAKYRADHRAEKAEYDAKYHAKYQAEHAEEISEYKAEHAEKIAEYQAEYRATHAKEIAEYGAKYYQEHKVEIAERTAKWHAEFCAKHPEYSPWASMLQRCTNPKNINYKNYGAKGVTVCDRWDPAKGGSFENFLADMGPRPSKKHSLSRTADTGNYRPGNVSWHTRSQQEKQKRLKKQQEAINV